VATRWLKSSLRVKTFGDIFEAIRVDIDIFLLLFTVKKYHENFIIFQIFFYDLICFSSPSALGLPRQQTQSELSKCVNIYSGQSWQPYAPDDQKIMVFSIEQKDGNNPKDRSKIGYRTQRMSFWNELIPNLLIGLTMIFTLIFYGIGNLNCRITKIKLSGFIIFIVPH
jgi:hypothetical protein